MVESRAPSGIVSRAYQPWPDGASLPLENGDRLSRCEFERRYGARPDIHKAELIEGVVYVPSPVRAASHGSPSASMAGWLYVYSAATPHVSVLDNATVRLDRDNEPQPDVLLRIDAAAGGQSSLSEDDYVEGAPELVVEVAASSAAYDLHDKLHVYRRSGVQEYIVWRVFDKAVDWFELVDDEFQPLSPVGGVYESNRFPGLRLAVDALLADDGASVLAELRRGIQQPPHAEFVAFLQHQQETPRGRG